MAIEMEKIEFKDNQEPAISGENLNKMQENMETALKEVEENAGSGDGILTGSVIGYNGDTIPEGYEEVDGLNKNIIQANLSIATTFTSNDDQYFFIPLDNLLNVYGDKLTLENGAIKVGKGISKVRVTSSVGFDGKNITDFSICAPVIYKNTYGMEYQRLFNIDKTSTYQYVINEAVIDVEEGDVIGVGFRTVAKNNTPVSILGGKSQTYIIVEAVSEKYIEKKSVAPVDPITGSIVDGTNIDNKSSNTYSANVIDEMLKVTEYDLSQYKTEKISSIVRLCCKKEGKTVNISGYINVASGLSENTNYTIFDLPDELMHDTEMYDFLVFCYGGKLSRGFVGTKTSYRGIQIRFTEVPASGDAITFNFSYNIG